MPSWHWPRPWYWPRPEEIIAAEQEKEIAEKSFLLEILKEHVDNTKETP
jgi:hypothetical protein